jgi:hypothetical protein
LSGGIHVVKDAIDRDYLALVDERIRGKLLNCDKADNVIRLDKSCAARGITRALLLGLPLLLDSLF